MNFFKKTSHNINLSIILFSLIIGAVFFSIYIILYLQGYTRIVSDSYKISAQQLAENISLALKVKDIPSVVKVSSQAFITKNSNFVEIVDDEGNLFFMHQASEKNKGQVCEYTFSHENVIYNNQKVGEIEYCYEIKFLPESNNLVFEVVFSVILLSLLLSSTNYFLMSNRNKPLYELISQIKKINPFSPSVGKIPDSFEKNQELILIYKNIFQLVDEVQKISKEREDMKAQVLIGQFAQMFAHDVKKPFNLLKMLLSDTDVQSSPQLEFNEKNKFILKELNKNIAYVDTLIRDVMDIGSKPSLFIEEISMEDLIYKVYNDNFLEKINERVCVEFLFQHTNKVFIDKFKIIRVLLNIISNALEANHNQGKIWIATQDIIVHNINYVEVKIGNNGSYVPEKEQSLLFDIFYTKNKKGGTGLGLAICKRIIEMHKGQIRCSSHFKVGTEFIFILPCFSTISLTHSKIDVA
jgi:signal transduction histidine kinase